MSASPLKTGVRNVLDNHFDGTTFLTIYIVLLFAVPSQLVVGPLGAAGSPAQLFALGGLLWWVADRFVQDPATKAPPVRPVRLALTIAFMAFLASFIYAMVRPIAGQESSVATSGMLAFAAWSGVLLIASDGIVSLDRFYVLLRRVVVAGGAMATLGLLQFVTDTSFVDQISIPGLTANSALTGSITRVGFTRAAGTAIHPIEFGSVLTMILPIALALAQVDRVRHWFRKWYAPAAIIMVVAVSISRSAMVGAVVGLLVVVVTWPATARRWLIAAGGVMFVGVFIAVPGLIGAVFGLFTGPDDNSTSSRTGSYPFAWELFKNSPVFGRGYGTLLPSYRIFDNQFLLLFVEVGAVGLTAIIGLFITSILAARRARQGGSPLIRATGQGLAAAVASAMTTMALFDGFSFPQSTGLLFLLFGLCGALRRLTSTDDDAATYVDVRARQSTAEEQRSR